MTTLDAVPRRARSCGSCFRLQSRSFAREPPQTPGPGGGARVFDPYLGASWAPPLDESAGQLAFSIEQRQPGLQTTIICDGGPSASPDATLGIDSKAPAWLNVTNVKPVC